MTSQNIPKPVVLVVLDGWGIAPASEGNAITQAHTPFIDSLTQDYPMAVLQASSEAVGLPEGEDGNTETGHLNMGAGRVVPQDLPRINSAISKGEFFNNHQFIAAINHVKVNQSSLHLIGLVGSGSVHSNTQHLYSLIDLARQQQVEKLIIHPITDGRDSPPTSGTSHIKELQAKLAEAEAGELGLIMGRYYAMDRDMRWERTQIAYEALTQGKGELTGDPIKSIQESYDKGFTDEFIRPLIITNDQGQTNGQIKPNDAVIFFNYRIDRPRQLTKAFVYPKFDYVSASKSGFDPYAIKYYGSHLKKPEGEALKPFDRGPILENLYFVTMTEYESGLPARVAFPPITIEEPLGKVIADQGLRQLRMAETEKERFVSFYFNGQREDPYPGEDKIIIPSPPVATYDTVPAMSSRELTQTLLDRLEGNNYDFILINYANPDMVAHTGNLKAGIQAAQITDENITTLVNRVLELDGAVVITADHGNIEEMIDFETGGIDTEHSTFPVPCHIISHQFKGQQPGKPEGALADVAPTILKLMNIPKPEVMTGESLI